MDAAVAATIMTVVNHLLEQAAVITIRGFAVSHTPKQLVILLVVHTLGKDKALTRQVFHTGRLDHGHAQLSNHDRSVEYVASYRWELAEVSSEEHGNTTERDVRSAFGLTARSANR